MRFNDIFNIGEDELDKLLLQQPLDINIFKSISRQKNGFLNKKLRSKIWPKLLYINRYQCIDYESYIDDHRDYTQVHIDIERSLWRLDDIKDWNDKYREKRREVLLNIIISILCKNKQLYYYQGYHDVISIILLTVEDDQLAFLISETISLNYFIDYMSKDFKIVSKSMNLIMIIVKDNDRKLYEYLQEAQIEPFFSTSWLITWFAHDINSVNQSARLFDALLCSHPSYCYYLCAALVIYIRDEIFQTDCDFATIHNFLVRTPSRYHIFPSEELIQQADMLFSNTPIEKLKILCEQNKELSSLIKYKNISCISKPYKILRFINTDWKLLEEFYLKPNNYIQSITAYMKDNIYNNIQIHKTKNSNTTSDIIKENSKNILSKYDYGWLMTNINLYTIIIIAGGICSYMYKRNTYES